MKNILVIIGIIALLILLWLFGKGCNNANKIVDDALINYEQFQDIYNTCSKINTDLCNMNALDESDKMFEQFSKNQRINTLKTQLNRWVEDYNAKSKMFNRGMWKSSALPYQLSVNQFNCY